MTKEKTTNIKDNFLLHFFVRSEYYLRVYSHQAKEEETVKRSKNKRQTSGNMFLGMNGFLHLEQKRLRHLDIFFTLHLQEVILKARLCNIRFLSVWALI